MNKDSKARADKLRKAIEAAKKEIGTPKEAYNVIRLHDSNCPFHLERFRKHEKKGDEIWKVRVVLDCITDRDRQLCQDYFMCDRIFTKVIMCKEYNSRGFTYDFL